MGARTLDKIIEQLIADDTYKKKGVRARNV